MQWLEAAMTVIAFLSLMYGVICIDEHFQSYKNESRFMQIKQEGLNSQILDKELSK